MLQTEGGPHESLWTYNTTKFAVKPNQGVYADGLLHMIADASTLTNNLDSTRACLASELPFVFGMVCYESMLSDAVKASRVVPMPGKKEKVEGGHAVLAFGYDDSLKVSPGWARTPLLQRPSRSPIQVVYSIMAVASLIAIIGLSLVEFLQETYRGS